MMRWRNGFFKEENKIMTRGGTVDPIVTLLLRYSDAMHCVRMCL